MLYTIHVHMNSRQIFSHCNHSQVEHPDLFISGSGDQVTTQQRTYRDLTSGLWNVNWGYNSEHYGSVIADQVACIHYYPNCFHSTTDITERAARAITDHYHMAGVYFGTGGGDSIRTSEYLARAFTGSDHIVAHRLGYHGTGSVSERTSCISQAITARTAAVIIEPVMTTSGVHPYPADDLARVAALRDQLGFLIIFDETVTGLRCSRGNNNTGATLVEPDIRIVSKGLTNGLFPFSATLVNSRVMHWIQTSGQEFDHGLTMSGHPVGAALMLRSLQLYTDSHQQRQQLQQAIALHLRRVPHRAHGLLYGIDVPCAAQAAADLRRLGYIIHPAEQTNTLIFAPMFTAQVPDYQTFFDYLHELHQL